MAEDTLSNDTSVDVDEDVPASTVRSLLRSRYIVIEGGEMTIEAREPTRRRRLHYQLQLARRLRAQMEQAADQAEASGTCDEARDVMVSNIPNINELTSLTEAVRGGYTLDTYQGDWGLQELEREENRQTEAAKVVLRNHLRSMHEQRTRDIAAARAAAENALFSPVARRVPVPMFVDSSLSPAAKRPTDRDSASGWSSPEASKKRKNRDTSPSSQHGASKIASKRPARKCHYCRIAKSRFRRCHFWYANGNRCGRVFCLECLVNNYGLPAEELDDPTNDTEWHCPACRGQCSCDSCDRKREKEQRRTSDESPGERRSSQRTSAGLHSSLT